MENKKESVAVFGGGCFWCMEPPFEQLPGVIDVKAGYCGGSENDASYDLVSTGKTRHYEAVKVIYNPSQVSFAELLDVFWRQIDPTDDGGQFADRGSHYKTAIFYSNAEELAVAKKSKDDLAKSKLFSAPIVTKILPIMPFYPAEEEHQDYYKKHTSRFMSYKKGSGRAGFIDRVWREENGQKKKGNPVIDKKQLKEKLTPLQYEVTQENKTEPPFKNKYWDYKGEGIYVDVVSGEPLFISSDKFDSPSGWPSFSRPLVPENIVEKEDKSLFTVRTEVRSKHGDSHLGHVFNDGPEEGGLRYCINSAALKFVAKEDLEREGYGEFLDLFVR